MDIDFGNMFGNDSGEDEDPQVLESYFVELSEFKRFIDPSAPLSIVRARKGMGKSALLAHLHYKLQSKVNDVVIRTTGNELLGLGQFSGKDASALENHWKQVICKRICLEIGRSIGFAASDDEIGMVELAELQGYKDRNLVSSLTDRVAGLLQFALGRATDGSVPTLPSRSKQALESQIETLRRHQARVDTLIWVLIDDVDAKYKDDPEHQERIGAFFSALRALAFSVQNLRLRASVRTDVWYNLRRMEDQDKLRQYVIDITWKDDALRKILAKKILSYFQRESNDGEYDNWDVAHQYREIMAKVFEGQFEWDGRYEEPFVALKILAGARPRWMGLLCRLAGQHAKRRDVVQGRHIERVATIGMRSVVIAMDPFGLEKMSDMQKEHAHQFADLGKLVDAFANGKREYNRYQLTSLIRTGYVDRVKTVPDVNGYPFMNDDQLGEFLFQIEFISAHRRGEKKYYLYQDSPELFQAEENRQNLISWVLNASYRRYLRVH